MDGCGRLVSWWTVQGDNNQGAAKIKKHRKCDQGWKGSEGLQPLLRMMVLVFWFGGNVVDGCGRLVFGGWLKGG